MTKAGTRSIYAPAASLADCHILAVVDFCHLLGPVNSCSAVWIAIAALLPAVPYVMGAARTFRPFSCGPHNVPALPYIKVLRGGLAIFAAGGQIPGGL